MEQAKVLRQQLSAIAATPNGPTAAAAAIAGGAPSVSSLGSMFAAFVLRPAALQASQQGAAGAVEGAAEAAMAAADVQAEAARAAMPEMFQVGTTLKQFMYNTGRMHCCVWFLHSMLLSGCRWHGSLQACCCLELCSCGIHWETGASKVMQQGQPAPIFSTWPQLLLQVFVDSEDADEAAAQLQAALSRSCPMVPPLMDPLVVAGPFGSGKRGVLQQLVKLLPGVLAVAPVVTTKERPSGAKDSE